MLHRRPRRATRAEQGSAQQRQREADDRAERKAAADAERKAYFDAAQKAYSEDTVGAVERHKRRLLRLAKQPWSYALMGFGMCVCNSSVCFSLAFSLCAWLAANRWLPAEPAKKARTGQSKGAPISRVLTLKDAFTTFPKIDFGQFGCQLSRIVELVQILCIELLSLSKFTKII